MKIGIKKLDEASERTRMAVVFTFVFVLLVGSCFIPESPKDIQFGKIVARLFLAKPSKNTSNAVRVGTAVKQTARAERDHEITATVICEMAIKAALRSPATADFPWLPDGVGRLINDNDIMRVLTYVDAQNGFGATVRTRFKCDCRQTGEKWVVVDLKTIGG